MRSRSNLFARSLNLQISFYLFKLSESHNAQVHQIFLSLEKKSMPIKSIIVHLVIKDKH